MQPIIVIGGGAAGLLAAGRAAERGHSVVLLEKGPRLGAKILASGGERCNVTNSGDAAAHASRFGRNGRFLRPAYSRFFNEDLRALFKRLGLKTKEENDGRIFPATDRATDVVRVLERWIGDLGVEVRLRTGVAAIDAGHAEASGDAEQATTWVTGVLTESGGRLPGRAVVVCTGGKSYPKLGTTGDGYRLAAALGHRIVECCPALAALHCGDPLCGKVQGLSLSGIPLAALSGDGKKIATAVGDVIFTHQGISGPAALNVSGAVAAAIGGGGVRVRLDLLPGQRDVDSRIAALIGVSPGRHIGNLLAGMLPGRLAVAIAEKAGIDPDTPGGQVTRQGRLVLAELLKRLELTVSGTDGFDRAMVTRGGVDLREVDPTTMGSKLVRGLFFSGELLDLDGASGGYNLQAAFSTGWVAGDNA